MNKENKKQDQGKTSKKMIKINISERAIQKYRQRFVSYLNMKFHQEYTRENICRLQEKQQRVYMYALMKEGTSNG